MPLVEETETAHITSRSTFELARQRRMREPTEVMKQRLPFKNSALSSKSALVS